MNEKKEIEKNITAGGTLYLVATPIGNLADITDRARKVLSEADFIAAEDTRRTGLLLRSLGIERVGMVSYYKDNMTTAGPRIVERLLAGESCALCTDAGMPAISDPGEALVRLCAEAGITVTCVPGACAAVTALALSALDTRAFTFFGFLPSDGAARTRALDDLVSERRTVIFYEAPHRLRRTLSELSERIPDRRVALCRELTKLNEEIVRATVAEAAADSREPRGEYVIVLDGAPDTSADDWRAMSVSEHVAAYEKSGLSRMDAIKAAARDRRVPKGEIYREIGIKKK